jgi:3-methyl-2-oxobutanoate hydroxymethyltransferase
MKSAIGFTKMKEASLPIVMLTAYDCPFARILDECGVDIVLVGDTVGTTVLGYDDITRVTMDDMIHHTSAVARGVSRAFVVGDMPYKSYATRAAAIKNAKRFLACGADAVKMEGGAEITDRVKAMRRCGIEVCGHIGYLPQSRIRPGVVGKTLDEAKGLVADALALQEAGVFMIVLELVPQELAGAVTRLLRIPTIGIGAGPRCDGQVQVFHDMAGLSPRVFRHVKTFANGKDVLSAAVAGYVREVREHSFPTADHAAALDRWTQEELLSWIGADRGNR